MNTNFILLFAEVLFPQGSLSTDLVSLSSSVQQNDVHWESKAASCSIKVVHQSFYTATGMGWHPAAFQGEHSPLDL